MPSRIWTLGAGGVAVVGAAVAGGYFLGHSNNPQPQLAQTTQAPPEQPAQPYPQENAQPSQNQGANYPPGYSQSVYSPWRNESGRGSARRHPRRVSFQYFRDSLSRHGRWTHSDRWGEVWQPMDAGTDFHPYERGHWADTREFGWTWVSDYEWGDIPFHYGRWVDDPERGWLWVPGYVWGPGWVVWRSGSHHTGWMPMPPDSHFLRGEENVRIDWSRESGDYGYRDWYGNDYDQTRLDSHWVYVDTGHLADRDYGRYEVRRPEEIHQLNIESHNVTNYVTVDNFIVNRSVDPQRVEEQSGRRIEAVPATTVVAKPELVVPVNTGTRIAVAARQDIPAGSGKPNSAPLANPAALHAPPPPVGAPLPPLPASAPTSVIATQGPPNAPFKPAGQKPNASSPANANASATNAPSTAPSAPGSTPSAPPQQAQQQAAPPDEHVGRHRHGEPAGMQPPEATAPTPQGAPPATANAQPSAPRAQTGSVNANEEHDGRHRHGGPWWMQQPGQPQTPSAANAASSPPASTAATQPPAPQEASQQPLSNPRVEKHGHGGMQQGGPGAGQNAQTNPLPPTAAPPSQQAQQPSAGGAQSASGPGEERFFARHGNRGRKEAEQGTSASAPAAPGAAQNNGASPAGQATSQSQQPSTAREQERKARLEEKKGEVVPSSLSPGSPSPYAQSPNGKSNAGGEGEAQDQSGSDQKHKKHREKRENPDEGGSPLQQQ